MAFRILGTRVEWRAEAERPRDGDVLVIPANDHLWMLSGPGLEIKKSLGKELEVEAVRLGPVAPGEVVATPGGPLGYRFLYHAVVMGQDSVWVEGAGRRAVVAAVERAIRDRAATMVFYPLYRGVHGRREQPLQEMLNGILEAAREGSPLKQILVLHENSQEKTFLQETFVRVLAESPHGGA